MRKKHLALALGFIPLILSGCSLLRDRQIDQVISRSPEGLRDCDRLGAKFLLQSYDRAGENMGRLTMFMSSTDESIKEYPKGIVNSFDGTPLHVRGVLTQKNGHFFAGGSRLVYTIFYYVSDDGELKYQTAKEGDIDRRSKYYDDQFESETSILNVGMDGPVVPSPGIDARKRLDTSYGKVCDLFFFGEGSFGGSSGYRLEQSSKGQLRATKN